MGRVGGGALIGDSRMVAGVVAVVCNHHSSAVGKIHEVLSLCAVAGALLRVAKGGAVVVI